MAGISIEQADGGRESAVDGMRSMPMRPWMIVLSSAIGAIVVAGAMVGPELSEAPRSDFGSILLPHLSMLAVAALAVYALCAMLLASGTLIGDALSVRRRLGRMGRYPRPTQSDWTTAFGSTELHRLMPSPVAEPTRRAGANETIFLQHPFSVVAARGEIARLHYLWLARTHFFSALIVLIALVGLGLAQDHGSVPFLPGEIPAISAILMLVGLILLAILSRIAIDVSTEPLIETISQLAVEHLEIGLLRRLVDVIEAVRTAEAVKVGAPASTLQLPDRLEAVIEEGQRGLLDATRHLSLITDAVGARIGSSVDALNAAINTAAVQLPPTTDRGDEAFGFSELQRLEAVIEEGQRGLLDATRHLSLITDAVGARIGSSVDALNAAINTAAVQLPPTADRGDEAFGFSELQRLEAVIEEGQRSLLDATRHLSLITDAVGAKIGSSVDALNAAINTASVQLPPTADRGNEAFGFSELRGAVEALTAVLERLMTVPNTTEDTSLSADRAARRKVQDPHLAHELRQLLQEIEAAG